MNQDKELKEALHKKELREAGDRSSSSTRPVTNPVTQDNISSQNVPTLTLSPSATNLMSQSAEPPDNFENKYQINLLKESFLDKQVTAELRTKENNFQQAAFDSQNQSR
ncbi:hypothetical protein Golomagni_05021 [Golovinomyces magnicellulatus]|nr:hypothetical protein Golomagni_05021 [Golovinomyces magnicellulatus]